MSSHWSVGFTGTQQGMTEKQKQTVFMLLFGQLPTEVHHGDCIGADADFHKIAEKVNTERIYIHPPNKTQKRAWCKSNGKSTLIILDPLPYLVRNRVIVDSTFVLIACPKEVNEVLRSGTWATIRYARKRNKKTILVLPSGEISGTS